MSEKIAPSPLLGLLNPAAFWLPDYLKPPSAWIEHGSFMFWLMAQFKPQRLVELGTHYGYSYFCACQAVQRLQLKTHCFAVDTWQGDPHASHYGEEVYAEVAQHNQQFAKFSTLLRMSFDAAVDQFADQSIDLLHIDGLHFYDSVAHDFNTWLPKLSPRGLVLFHDTAVHERDFGVWKFFTELKQRYPAFEFYHGNGLGIIAPGEVPDFFKEMVQANSHEQKFFCDVFAGLGQRLSEQRQLLLAVEKAAITPCDETVDQPAPLPHATQLALQALAGLPDRLRLSLSWPQKIWRRLGYQFSPDSVKLNWLKGSGFFDAGWYYQTYPDVAVALMDAAEHYFYYGAREGRNPGPAFSTQNYYERNPHAALYGINPLLHMAGYQPLLSGRSSLIYHDQLSAADRQAITKHLASMARKPLISVVMPVYNTPEHLLREAIASVQAQLYSDWELCIADDASPQAHVRQILTELSASDSRIKVVYREKNGNISAASNSALELAHGEFVALLDHDDLLHETALYEVAVTLQQHPDADVIYSDEDLIDEKGQRSQPYFKPDFNPELILGQNMVSHLGVYRRALLEQIGGFREGYEGSQDYDLFLRIWSASANHRIHHIPAVLYHWRKGTSAPSFSEKQLEKCTQAARRAIQDYLGRENEGAEVVAAAHGDYSRIKRQIPAPPPLVSVIIPTKDQAGLLRQCVEGVLTKTNYAPLEVIIIDHESREPETQQLFDELRQDERVKIIPYRGEFNYSAMNNMAVAHAKGEVLLLLNNDIAVLDPDWLREMVSHVVRPEVGAVGAKLLYPDKRVQHAGVVIGLGGVAGHYLCGIKDSDYGYFAQAALARSSSAVTAACLAVRRQVFLEVGGLEEDGLKVAFNDVDLCLKIQARGYRNVWTPFAKLLHYESISRGPDSSPEKVRRINREIAFMRKKWPGLIANDPFYNPNLSLNSPHAEMARPSRRQKPWSAYL